MRVDGHDIDSISKIVNSFLSNDLNSYDVIVADTIKGKGISFMEKDPKWHHRKIKAEEYDICIRELT